MNKRFFLFGILLVICVGHVFSETGSKKVFTLKSAIRYSLKHSPILKMEEKRMDEIKFEEGEERSKKKLHLNLNGDALFSRMNKPIGAFEPEYMKYDNILFNYTLSAGYLIYDFKSIDYRIEALEKKIQAEKLIKKRKEEFLIFKVSTLYLKILTYGDLIAAENSLLKSLLEVKRDVENMIKYGKAVQVDLLKVETMLARTNSTIDTLKAERDADMSSLGYYLGFEGDFEVSKDFKDLSIDESYLKEKPNFFVKEGLKNRLDLLALKMGVEAIGKEMKSVDRSKLPELSFFSGFKSTLLANPVSFKDIMREVMHNPYIEPGGKGHIQNDWFAGFRVKFNILDGGMRKNRFLRLNAQKMELLSKIEDKKNEIVEKIKRSIANYRSNLSKVDALKESVKKAKETLRVEKLKYKFGKSPINFVLDAEAELLKTKSLLSLAKRGVDIAFLDILFQCGKIDEFFGVN